MGAELGVARRMIAAVLMALLPVEAICAQGTIIVPVGGDKPPPVPQNPPADPEDTPEEIAKDAARDLKDTRFYNRPGATRADYDKAWQECRLIARGSRTPAGSVPYYYDPSLMSPLAAGIGAGIGGLIGGMIVQGEQRRTNRRQCLLIRGWRLVEVPSAQAEKLKLMTDADRDAYFNSIVGAETVDGEITTRTSFTQISNPLLTLDAPFAGEGTLFAGKKVDPAATIPLGDNEALIVVAFRRPIESSVGRSSSVSFARYDTTGQDLIYQPRDWKKKGDLTTYRVSAASADKKASYEVQLIKVTAGDYVLDNMTAGPVVATSSNCFGAPAIHVEPGAVVYAGDFVPVMGLKLSEKEKIYGATFWTSNLEQARKVIAAKQPALADKLAAAAWRNQATYACSAIVMDRFDLPPSALVEPAVATEAPPQEAPQAAPVTASVQ
jgi:hypothetical protein